MLLLNFIYLILACVALYFEFSKCIDTRGIFTKMSLFAVIAGSILGLNHIDNNLIVIGLIGYAITHMIKILKEEIQSYE